jgi:hypothetical protein
MKASITTALITAALFTGLVSLHACTDTDDPDVGTKQQNEIIEIHGGCPPGTIGNGEICVDPLEGGGSPGGGGGPTGGDGGPGGPGGPGPGGGGGGGSGCPSGGGGGCGADPHPIPAPKDCTLEVNHEACHACCDWNVDKVWGERCRRLPRRTKKQRKEKAVCWETAERLRGECQRGCPRPSITTVAP